MENKAEDTDWTRGSGNGMFSDSLGVLFFRMGCPGMVPVPLCT